MSIFNLQPQSGRHIYALKTPDICFLAFTLIDWKMETMNERSNDFGLSNYNYKCKSALSFHLIIELGKTILGC